MKCNIIFTVNGEPISLDLETDLNSPLTDLDIIKVLIDNPEEREKLATIIHTKLYTQSTISEVTINNIINKEGLLGNCGIEYLKEEFGIEFPEGVEANVLLLDNLNIKKLNIYGRIINSNGKEIFVVKSDKEDIKALSDFLRVRQLLELQSFLFSEESNYYKNLLKILIETNKNKKDFLNIFDLVLDYLNNKKFYRDIYITNDKGKKENAYSILYDITNIILQYSSRVEYADEFINTINKLIYHFDNNSKYLELNSLYAAVKNYYPDVLKQLNINNKTEFDKFFSENSSKNKQELEKVFGNVISGSSYHTLFLFLFKKEPDFNLVFVSSSNKGVTFKSEPKTLQSKYGIGYDTIHTFDIINNDYKGYKIYAFFENGKRKFIPSKTYLTENTITNIYDTKKDAKRYIDESVKTKPIIKNHLLDFKFRDYTKVDGQTIYDNELSSFSLYTNLHLEEQSIIESIDIPLIKNTRIFNGENILFEEESKNYNSFIDIIKKWNISSNLKKNIASEINTPEKIAIFIYKVNELLQEKRDNEEVIKDIISKIKEAPKKAYYIESRSFINNRNQYVYRIIPTNPILIENYKRSKTFPVVSLMQAIDKVLSDKFGVSVNMQTSDEIENNFPDIDVNTAKAFIRDGQIYINTTIAKSSDLLHEYVHLILGVLKANPDLRTNYEQLLDIISKTKEGKEMRKKLVTRYENISEMDLMEEIFAKLFSEHIMRNLNPKLNQIFEGQKRFLTDVTKIVFNNAIPNLKSFYGKSIESVFTRFNSDVSFLLNQPNLDFNSTKTYRLYSNWISKQIQKFKETDGKDGINEQCYG